MWHHIHPTNRFLYPAVATACSVLLGCTAWYWSGASAAIAAGASALVCATIFVRGRRWGAWMICGLVLHVYGGIGLGLYSTAPWFDLALHVGIVAWLMVLVLDAGCLGTLVLHQHSRILVAALLALGLGAAWELLEAMLDSLFVLGAQPNLHDTNLDLAADLAGGLIASFAISPRSLPRADPTTFEPVLNQPSPGELR